jgi:cation diffusion facilitator family transporter
MQQRKATILNIIINLFLFILKLIAGILSKSIAIISDAINSFTDVVTSIIIWYSVKISRKKADYNHPYGHHRAQPIAGLIVAVFALILGFEVIRSSIERFFSDTIIVINYYSYVALIIAILTKFLLAAYLINIGKKERSPALKAAGIDSRNDVLSSLVALIGIIGYQFGLNYLDAIAGILIGIIILKFSIDIAKENLPYLMGESPSKKYHEKISKMVLSVKGVKNIHNLKIHYVGNYFHIEVHIEVDGNLKTKKSHLISNKVEKEIQTLKEVDKVFVHVDPV